MIGIIAAMDSEVEAIVQLLKEKEEMKKSGIYMVKGWIGEQSVIVMKSGVGKGNATMTTTILLENFSIEKLINIGTAGGLDPKQEILDAVVSISVVQHDFDTSAVDGKDGIGLYYEANKQLVKQCKDILESLDIRVHCGLIASGDQFIANEEQLSFLKKKFPDAICAEMEAGAIAQVCSHYQIPFVVLRSLSDIAFRNDSHMDFQTYVQHAANRSAKFCEALLQQN